MIRAVLLDLDNTLLENDMETFVPAYLGLLSQFIADYYPPDAFIRHLMRATDAMMANNGSERTNREVFDAAFFPAIGRTREEMEPLFEEFYATRFPALRALTRPVRIARPLMEWLFRQGFQVAIATNSLFPRTAIEQRLAWANVPMEEFPYHLITSYEVMHASKPHPAFFSEIAQRLGRAPEECIMVGDEWKMDIHPARQVGMQTFWIADRETPPPAGEPPPDGQGALADFARWMLRKTG
ncbi:MAG: HAD family hydrolase [Anaerolineae bacterium]|nr:HAD family hydrolase [Anaerolineae bacterium]